MRRGGGVIPPGKAGLIVIAAALVPVAIKQFKPAVRWLGKKMQKVGEQVEKSVEEVERYDREKAEKQSATRTRSASRDENAPTPGRETASPHGQVEVEAHKTKPKKAAAASHPRAKRSPRKPIKGASPPANNSKRSRPKPEGEGGAESG